MTVNDGQNKHGEPRESNKRLNQEAKTMGKVDHEFHGQIKGQICKFEKCRLDRECLGIKDWTVSKD